MKKHAGRTQVTEGYYLNLGKWELVPMPSEGGILPGSPQDAYVRVSTPLALALTPVLGGLFVIFLPVIGFVLVAHAVFRRGEAAAPALGAEAEPT